MGRFTIATLAALLVIGSSGKAEDLRGKVKSTDTEKNTITVTVADKDQTLTVAKDAKITRLVGKKVKKAQPEDVPGGLGGLSAGTDVSFTTDKKGDAELVTQIKVEGLSPKKKKKAK